MKFVACPANDEQPRIVQCCGASRRRKPAKHTAPSVPGPAGMACGASLATAAKAPDKMLQHPFQALACVRQAARARHIDISSWDLAPGA